MIRSQLRQPVGDRDDLVDLLLVLDDGELHLGVLEHVGHLVGHQVLVDRHRNAAEALHGREGGIQARAVVADDGDGVAALEPELAQADGEERAPRRAAAPTSRSARCRSPCGAWPAARHGGGIAQQQLRHGVEHCRACLVVGCALMALTTRCLPAVGPRRLEGSLIAYADCRHALDTARRAHPALRHLWRTSHKLQHCSTRIWTDRAGLICYTYEALCDPVRSRLGSNAASWRSAARSGPASPDR